MELDYLQHDAEMYHYGVKGMKWGKRRYRRTALPTDLESMITDPERRTNNRTAKLPGKSDPGTGASGRSREITMYNNPGPGTGGDGETSAFKAKKQQGSKVTEKGKNFVHKLFAKKRKSSHVTVKFGNVTLS